MASHARLIKALARCVTVKQEHKRNGGMTFELRTLDGESLFVLRSPSTEDLADKLVAALEAFETSPALFEFLFSMRPVTDDDRRAVAARVEEFWRADIQCREAAEGALVKLGAPALASLRAVDRKAMTTEALGRADAVITKLQGFERTIQRRQLDRDVLFLAGLKDPRAHERLRRICGGLRPFAKDGFPEPGPSVQEYVRGWWAWAQSRATWSVETDRYEPRE